MLGIKLYCCLSKFESVDYLELQHRSLGQRSRVQELKHGKLGIEKKKEEGSGCLLKKILRLVN